MNANEVNAVIDNLADKLGLAAGNAAQLVPEFAKYSIATDAAAGVRTDRRGVRGVHYLGGAARP